MINQSDHFSKLIATSSCCQNFMCTSCCILLSSLQGFDVATRFKKLIIYLHGACEQTVFGEGAMVVWILLIILERQILELIF